MSCTRPWCPAGLHLISSYCFGLPSTCRQRLYRETIHTPSGDLIGHEGMPSYKNSFAVYSATTWQSEKRWFLESGRDKMSRNRPCSKSKPIFIQYILNGSCSSGKSMTTHDYRCSSVSFLSSLVVTWMMRNLRWRTLVKVIASNLDEQESLRSTYAKSL